MDEMEAMRIEGELNRGKGRGTGNSARNGQWIIDNKDGIFRSANPRQASI